MDVDRAIQFIERNGTPVEKARLAILLSSKSKVAVVDVQSLAILELKSSQHRDGGWAAFWSRESSSLDATCHRLSQCEQLKLPKHEPMIQRALNFLLQRKSPSEYFEEDESLRSQLPPWLKHGDLSARTYLTANVCFWLQTFGEVDVVAVDYLHGQVAGNGSLPGYLHTNWLAAAVFYSAGKMNAALSVMDYLEVSLSCMSPGNLAWMVHALRIAGVSRSSALLSQSGDRLRHMQSEDGSWESDDGEGFRVNTTLEALSALWYVDGEK